MIAGCGSQAWLVGFWLPLPYIWQRDAFSAEAVSEAFFFWYVFPLLVAAGIFGWLAYDRYSRRSNRRLHPGE